MMYIFYGSPALLDEIEKIGKKKEEDIRSFNPSKKDLEGLIGFVKDNLQDIEILVYLEIESLNLLKLSEKVKKLDPDIVQIALVEDKEAEELGSVHVLCKKEELVGSLFRKIDRMMMKRKSEELEEVIASTNGKIAVFLHDNPDPDAIASAMAFEEICESEGVEAVTYFGGSVGHPENEVLLKNTGFDIKRIDSSDVGEVLDRHQKIALLDNAKPSVNNVLPENLEPDIIIDHHYTSKDITAGEYNEIRNDVGATSTIMTKHLQNLDMRIKPLLASALLTGIKVDTHDYTKNISTADHKAIAYLSALADEDILDILKEPSIYPETMDAMGIALSNREVHDTVLTAFSEKIYHRDDLPQIADFLLRERDIMTVLVYGIKDDKIHMSARSKDMQINIGKVMKKIYSEWGQGGGHQHAAGGQVDLKRFETKREAVEKVKKLFIDEVVKR